jgi:hypothetical protein
MAGGASLAGEGGGAAVTAATPGAQGAPRARAMASAHASSQTPGVRYGTGILARRARESSQTPAAASARTSVRPAARRLRAVMVVLLIGGLVAACGSSTSTMNTAEIERAIEATILARDGVHTTVTCPERVTVKSGYRFTCSAALAVGAYLMYVVEDNTRGSGTYSSHTPLRVLDSYTIERAIQSAIKHQRHLTASVVCPEPILQSAALSFSCSAALRGASTEFAVTETDSDGHVTIVGP